MKQIQDQEDYESEDALEAFEAYAMVKKKVNDKKIGRGFKNFNSGGNSGWNLQGTIRAKIDALKSKTKCHVCRRTGHWKKECPLRNQGQGKGGGKTKKADDTKEVHYTDEVDGLEILEAVREETGSAGDVDSGVASRKAEAPKKSEISKKDSWIMREGKVVRLHQKIRKGLFTPHGVAGMPANENQLSGERRTIIHYENGTMEEIKDNYHTAKVPHLKLKGTWTGETQFELKGPEKKVIDADECEALIVAYEQDVLRAVAEGAQPDSVGVFESYAADHAALDEHAVPDTACRKTLIGEYTLYGMESKLRAKGFDVHRFGETNEFRFGNAGTLTSKEVARIPIRIGRSRMLINAAILPGSGARTPLLFSKELMKCLKGVIDLEKDEMFFRRLNERVKLSITQRGHYAIPVLEATEPAEILESHDPGSRSFSARPGAHEGVAARRACDDRRLVSGEHRCSLRRLFGQHGQPDQSTGSGDGWEVQESADDGQGVHLRQGLPAVDSTTCEGTDLREGDEETSPLHRMQGSSQEDQVPAQSRDCATSHISAEASAQGKVTGHVIDEQCDSDPGSNASLSKDGDASWERRRWMGTTRGPESHGHRGVGAMAQPGRECCEQVGGDHCWGDSERRGKLEEEEGSGTGAECTGKAMAFPGELSEPNYSETLLTSADVEAINKSLRSVEPQNESSCRTDVFIITPDPEVDVTEIFSMPRVCKAAKACGFTCGGSYDIQTGCDLSDAGKRSELREKLKRQKPKLLVICPPCGPFSQMQEISKHKNMKLYLEKLAEGKKLLRFSMELIDDQIKRGGMFLFEQPLYAKSWKDRSVQNVEKHAHVYKVAFDQCMYGLRDRVSDKLHRKATGVLTNSEMIARELQLRCDKLHEHEPLEGNVKVDGHWVSRTSLAQEYPPLLVAAMLRGLMHEKEKGDMSHVEHCVLTVDALNTTDERALVKMLRRCHENLGHPSTPRFVAMLKAARATEVCIKLAKGLTCSTCKELTGQKSHNVAKAVKDMQFNDMVCVDTFEVELPTRKVKFLNMVDMATRYQVCVPMWKGIEVRRVRAGYRRYWKRWAGAPRVIVSDGGPEFTEAWTDLLAHDGTDHHVTAAHAPWQNGMCERLGGAWKVAFAKAALEVDARTKEELEEVTDQVNLAHNSLTRHHGYSPNQQVLGTEIRLPGLNLEGDNETMDSAVLTGEPLYVRSEKIRNAARKALLAVDSEDRLRRAAAHRTRPKRGPFMPKDKVMIWRKGRQEKKAHWHGPACVVGTDPSRVFVAYGAKLYRCAPEQVRHVDQEILDLMEWLPPNLMLHRDSVRERGAGNIVELDAGPFPPLEERRTEGNHESQEAEESREPSMSAAGMSEPMEVEGNLENEPAGEMPEAERSPMAVEQIPPAAGGSEQQRQTSDASMEEPQHEPDSREQHQTPGETTSAGDTIQSGQLSGGYGPVRQTRLTEALRRSLDSLDFGRPRQARNREADVLQVIWDKQGEESILEEVYVVTTKKAGRKEVSRKQLSDQKLQELEEARVKEWQKMISSGSIKVHRGEEAVKRKHEVGTDRILESRYVYTSDDGTSEGKLKARWCIRGYLDPDIMNLDTASPTLSTEGLATTLQLISSMGWRLSIADIEAAFLRGDLLDRKQGVVLVRVPQDGIPGLEKGDIIELIRPVYGLADAPRLWWQSLTRALKELGMEQSKLDSCIFYCRKPDRSLSGVISFHVDDLLIGGDAWFYSTVFEKLKQRYPFKHIKQDHGEFLGKQLKQNEDGSISVQQKEYSDNLQSISICKERRKERDQMATDEEKSQMRAVLGEVNWLVSGSRPDLAAACSLMQQKVTKATVQDVIDVNRVVALARDFASTEVIIRPVKIEDLEFVTWSDASFANAGEKKSQGGYLICAADRRLRLDDWGKISPLRWRSYKQDRQVASTLGAELLSLSRAIAETKWMRSLWVEAISRQYRLEKDSQLTCQIAITVVVDSKPAFDHLNGQVMTIKDKRLAIEMLLVRQDVESEGVQVRWTPTDRMLADSLTKLWGPQELLRKVLKEGKMILVENDQVTRWAGKLKRRVNGWLLFCEIWEKQKRRAKGWKDPLRDVWNDMSVNVRILS